AHAVMGSGGTAVWVEGPEGQPSDALAEVAQRKGVLIEPGAIFFAGGRRAPAFRLGLSSIATERIAPGIRLLAEAAAEVGAA
ncbi:MAG: PLP-dependent aminotransferase family protein, partial [Rhodobiaceae bacterium]|nr:PLP-dependent aminotransferase family protein [Rhodobiaceae bacterium]